MLLEPAEINARIRPMNDREIARFVFRAALFERRGLTPELAERVADRLALRDQERDDRRCCLECTGLDQRRECMRVRVDRQTGAKGAARHMPDTSNDFQPMPITLQRCAGFSFVTP